MTLVVWGVHMGSKVGTRPYDEGYVAIGWKDLDDIRQYRNKEDFKRALERDPSIRRGAVPVYAGLLNRFVHEMKADDVIVYPSKIDRQICIGRLTGETNYDGDEGQVYPNRRMVEWIGHFPRSEFSQSALNEVGSALTLFKIKNHCGEFLAKIPNFQIEKGLDDADDARVDDDSAAYAVASQAEETTNDFIIKRIMQLEDGYGFEEFAAHILQCMGYQARVTPKSGDGGVDVIAHQDALGFKPPIIKVQCKRSEQQFGEREVFQLKGTLGDGEYGLFISLGSYTRQARVLERNSPKLRLIDGEEFSQIIMAHYSKLAPRYRSIIPLKEIYVPDLSGME